MRLLVTLAFLMSLSGACLAQPKIAWFSTLQANLSEKSGFWKRVHDLVISAGEDLNLDLDIYYAEENYILLSEQVERMLSDPATRPDGIIFHNYKNTGEFILSKAEQHGVKSMIFNAGFSKSKEQGLKPRKKYKHWIGQILPDDEYAGAELLRQLYECSKQLFPKPSGNQKTQVLAMEGNRASGAYLARKRGLEAALSQTEQVEFTQYVPADWSRTVATNQFPTIIRRYPNVGIFWSANDNMALGLIDAALEQSYQPGKDFMVGGVDWLPESFDSMRRGHMAVTIGGHFVEGMWALVLLYDFLNGYDFKEAHGTTIKTQMLAVTKDLLSQYGNITNKLALNNIKRFDFKTLTRTHRPDATSYQFDISYLLENL